MSQHVLVIAEQTDGKFKNSAFEVVSEGCRLATALKAKLTGLVMGNGVSEIAGELGKYGADIVLCADDPILTDYTTDAYLVAVIEAVNQMKPRIILGSASIQSRDLFARLAAKLNAGLAPECTRLHIEGDNLAATRPVYGGKLISEVVVSGTPQIATLRPKAVTAERMDKSAEITPLSVTIPPSQAGISDKQLTGAGRVELTEADFIVSGGRGMGGPDYQVLEALAEALGGTVGASRSAVDEGWRPVADQVGQTGKVVSPRVYIACGISGAIQHLAGIRTSDIIVAVNRDPDAPIFKIADYGIVGDLFDLIPAITAEVKR